MEIEGDDFEQQSTTALKISRAQEYLTNLRRQLRHELGQGSNSISSNVWEQEIRNVTQRLKELEALPDAAGTGQGRVLLVRPTRPN